MVDGEDELAQVFSSLPSLSFDFLIMHNNQNVKVLRAGVFGKVTFKKFSLTWGVLEEVEADALDGSKDIVTRMDFDMNHISIFPFETLKRFPNLTHLSLSWNSLSDFPRIYSQSLTDLWLIWNPMGNVPADAFTQLPSLSTVRLGHSELTSIEPAIFMGLFKFYDVNNLKCGIVIKAAKDALRDCTYCEKIYIYVILIQKCTVKRRAYKPIFRRIIHYNGDELIFLKPIMPSEMWKCFIMTAYGVVSKRGSFICTGVLRWFIYELEILNEAFKD
ncbi:unnamed protein product, partial [Meganyctiphanes norvegica]